MSAKCSKEFELQKEKLKSLMKLMQVSTLFVTYNSVSDELIAYGGSSNCSEEFTCCCDECLSLQK